MEIRRIFALSFPFLLIFWANSETFFTGEMGANVDFASIGGVKLQGFLTGQLSFSPNVFARAEVSLKTGNIAENPLDDIESAVKMNELSLTFTKPSASLAHFFSAFIGNADPIGTDTFLRHQFGTAPLVSPLTQSYTGANGILLYPLRGIGASYIIRFSEIPIATGIYVYKNNTAFDENNSTDEIKLMPNIDLRFATSTQFFTIDTAFGVGLPLKDETMDSNGQTKEVFLLIDEIYIHTGLTAFFGSNEKSGLFIQAGFQDVTFGSNLNSPSAENTVLIFEPRFLMKSQTEGMNLTFFNIPKGRLSGGYDDFSYNNFIFIDKDNTFGANFMFYTDRFVIQNTSLKIGLNLMLAFDSYFDEITKPKDLFDKKEIKIAPFAETHILGGKMSASIQIKPIGSPKFRASIGYKKIL